MNMADSWFYAKAGNRMGPVTLEQLKAMIASGQVFPGDMVWRDGMAQWAPAGSMPELGGQPLPPPTPVAYVPPAPAVPLHMRPEPWTPTQRTMRIMLIIAAGIVFLCFFSPHFIRLTTDVSSPYYGNFTAEPGERIVWGWGTWFGITIFIISVLAIGGVIVELCLRKVKIIPAIFQWIHLGLFGMMGVMCAVGTILGLFGIGTKDANMIGYWSIPVGALVSLMALGLGVTVSIMLITKHRSKA
jgi:hypothetical protein